MASFNVPDGYVLLRDVFHKMAVSEAIAALGDKCPSISEKTKEAISKYHKDFFKYERELIVNMIAPPADNQKPTRPICPSEVKDFINTLQGNGDSIERHEGIVKQFIETKKLAIFAIQAGGILRGLRPGEINFYTLSLEPDSLEPVALLESEIFSLINRPPINKAGAKELHSSAKRVIRFKLDGFFDKKEKGPGWFKARGVTKIREALEADPIIKKQLKDKGLLPGKSTIHATINDWAEEKKVLIKRRKMGRR